MKHGIMAHAKSLTKHAEALPAESLVGESGAWKCLCSHVLALFCSKFECRGGTSQGIQPTHHKSLLVQSHYPKADGALGLGSGNSRPTEGTSALLLSISSPAGG